MKLICALLGTSALACVTPAFAQPIPQGASQTPPPLAAPPLSPDAPRAAAPTSRQVEEIIVTAQRREQRLQDVPIAVTALDATAVERLHARDIRDLTGSVPNLTLNEVSIGPSMSQISIRGVNSQDPEKSFDPAVGVFIDGVYLGTSAFNLLDSFDLQRIEVLRGPQGTLFGRNTTGGAINALRSEPTGKFGAKVRAIFGSASRHDFAGVFNAPIIQDVLAAKLSFTSDNDDGIFPNTAGGSTGAKDRWAISGSLKFTPNDRLKAVLTYDHANDDSELTPYRPQGVAFASPLPVRITQTTFPTSPAVVIPAFPADPLCVLGKRCQEAESSSTDPHFQNSEMDAVTLNASYKLSQYFTLAAVLGYRSSKENVYIDFDGTDLREFDVVRSQDYEQNSAEFRVASNFGGKFDFVSGFFYFQSHYKLRQAIKLDARLAGVPVPLGTLYVNGSGDEDFHRAFTKAVFLQGDYKLTSQLTLTVGGRYTWDDKTISTAFKGAPFSLTAPYQVTDGVPANRPTTSTGGASASWSEFTPKVALNWKPSRNLLLYGSYSRGYNAGGFSARAGTVADVTTPFNPETIDAFEAGVKSDLLDGRLRLNVAVFLNNYNDKQEETIVPGPPPSFTSTTVRNVAGARITGLELEATALVTDQFRIDGSFGYMNAEYTDFNANLANGQYISTPAQPAGTLISADLSTLHLRRAPEFTASLQPSYTVDVGFGEVNVNGTVRYTDVSYSEFFNNFRGKVPSQITLDASASLAFGGDSRNRYRVTVFAKNLSDNRNITGFTNSLVDFGTTTAPRTFGVELQAQF